MPRWCVAMAVVVTIVYASPLVAWYAKHKHLLAVVAFDEELYSARVMDAYRGGSMASPYLVEHEDAQDYMPQMSERAIALAARLTGMSPLGALAITRVLFPLAIFILIWMLGRRLGLTDPLAAMAGSLATLASAHSALIPGAVSSDPLFPRYFRTVSPGAHLILLLVAMLFLHAVIRVRSTATILAAGVCVGALFYVPVYYWSFAVAGTLGLMILATQEVRRDLLLVLLIAAAFAIPPVWHSLRVARDPDVADTLARLELLTPGRAPDPDALRYAVIGLLFLAPAVLAWKSLGHATFLAPFLAAGPLLFLQNAVTNRHIQSHHFVICLTPCWALVIAALWQRRPVLVAPGAIALTLFAGWVMGTAYLRLEAAALEEPALYNLNGSIPRTLEWLNQSTPARSVVLSSDFVMSGLVLFTHNKVYWSNWAWQHTLSSAEVELRQTTMNGPVAALPYRADYYLSIGAPCSGAILYQNPQERTCIVSLAKQSR